MGLVAKVGEVYHAFLPVKLNIFWQVHFKNKIGSATKSYAEHVSILRHLFYDTFFRKRSLNTKSQKDPAEGIIVFLTVIRFLFLGHRSFTGKITHKVLINMVK